MFKEIVKKQRHSVQYDDYDFETGMSHAQIAQHLANEKSTFGNNTSIYKIDTKSTYSVGKNSSMKLSLGNGFGSATNANKGRNLYYSTANKTPITSK